MCFIVVGASSQIQRMCEVALNKTGALQILKKKKTTTFMVWMIPGLNY